MRRSTATSRIHTVIDATRIALSNPEDTAQAFRIAEALSFGTPERLLAKLRRDPTGQRLLAQRDDLLSVLSDRAALEAKPAGSLAHAYLAFIDSENITPDGLVDASMEGAGDVSEVDANSDLGFVRRRMRDTHDLWHTVSGYKGDLLGEASLLAFTFAQTHHPGLGFLAALGMVFGHAGQRDVVYDGFKRGRRAEWLVAQDWVALLPRPLEEVRAELGIDYVPTYEEVREVQHRFGRRARA